MTRDARIPEASSAGARLALGGVRSAARYPPLPATGPARQVALRQLKAVISADAGRALDAAIDAGWHALDHEEVVEGYVVWMRRFVLEAIAEGVMAWRESQP